MARASDGYDVGGGVSVAPVKLRADWQAFLDSIPNRVDPRARVWTPEEDAFLRAARAAGAPFAEVCDKLGVAQNTARRHMRELGIV